MNLQDFQKFLIENDAAANLLAFAKGKTYEEFYNECENIIWLSWLYTTISPKNISLKYLISGYCARSILHLMNDNASKKAVLGVIDFGNGFIDEKKLKRLSKKAYKVYSPNDSRANSASFAAYASTVCVENTNSLDIVLQSCATAHAEASWNCPLDAQYTYAWKLAHKVMCITVRKNIPIELWNTSHSV